ncbi:MAG TPA: MFS transporter [Bacteroidota bacterium]|nr:MFS transporter [Bacteroidota bacterium]
MRDLWHLVPGDSPTERRNFLVNGVEGALAVAAAAFINPQTVLPALVNRLGGSNVVVGTLGVLVNVGIYIPQIFAARYVETIPWKKPWAVRYGLTHRMFVLVMAVAILLLGADHPGAALWIFLVLFTAMQVVVGVATPGWFDLFAKLTPARKRGRLVGLRNSAGGLCAFACGVCLTWILARFAFPSSYAIAFFAAFALQMGSFVLLGELRETEPSTVSVRRPFFAFLKELPGILTSNPPFRKFINACAILTFATMPVSFYTVYALEKFSADESAIGEFTLIMVAIQVVSALVTGYLADRYGNKTALLVASVSLLGASIMAFAAPSLGWFSLVYLLLGINLGTEITARYNMSIEYGPAKKRSTYVGLMNTLLAPFYLSGIIGGILSAWIGLRGVFLLGGLSSVTGIVYLARQVKEPRTIMPQETHA